MRRKDVELQAWAIEEGRWTIEDCRKAGMAEADLARVEREVANRKADSTPKALMESALSAAAQRAEYVDRGPATMKQIGYLGALLLRSGEDAATYLADTSFILTVARASQMITAALEGERNK